MIPWAIFNRSEQGPDLSVALDKGNLRQYVAQGPNQLQRCLDSPMLEQAHERQFAISQLGLGNASFEDEHITRIQGALRLMFHHLINNEIDEEAYPASPHAEDLVDLRSSHRCLESLPPLDVLENLQVIKSTPSVIAESTKSCRSSMSLHYLLNPAACTPKRKSFNKSRRPTRPDGRISTELKYSAKRPLHVTLDHVRAEHSIDDGTMRQTPRIFQMQRPQSMIEEAKKFEAAAHLLFTLSQA